jgi:isopentenyl phosphate kinase
MELSESSLRQFALLELPEMSDILSPDPQSPITNLQFLKLGGSLITDKTRPHSPRLDLMARLADEIVAARRRDISMQLILGHGSGSFGHVPASQYGTRQGVKSKEEWQGFVEVWREAIALNRLVIESLGEAGLPAVAFPPLASVIARDGRVEKWDLSPIIASLQAGLLPVVFGDVVFDSFRGGTILSTEDLFDYLARRLTPRTLLFAGLEPGVWIDFPACTQLIEEITPSNLSGIAAAIGASAATDVTGGMISKVQQSLELVRDIPGLEVRIFSGEISGLLERALLGEPVGTVIRI